MQEQLQTYKVTNATDKDVYRSWTLTLLTPALLQDWEAYKKTEQYLGSDPRTQAQRKRIPEAIKLREWVNTYQIGEVEQELDTRTGRLVAKLNMNPITRVREAEYKFKLPANSYIYMDETQVENFRVLEKKAIIQDRKDPKSAVHYEGYLEIEPVSPVSNNEMFVAMPLEQKEAPKIAEILASNKDTAEALQKLSYGELKTKAASKGIKSFGVKREDLIQQLLA